MSSVWLRVDLRTDNQKDMCLREIRPHGQQLSIVSRLNRR